MKGKQAVDIGTRRELFVDRHIIGALDGAALRLHHPQKMPLAEHPLKNCQYMTIIKEGALFRAYYRSFIPSYGGQVFDGCPREITCYSESNNGHEWSFPELGLIEIEGSRKNNVILHEAPYCHNFSPFLDTRPGVPSSERYKAFGGLHEINIPVSNGGGGLFAFVSGDGIRWEKLQERPVIISKPFAFDSQNAAFWSDAEKCYVCYFRTWEGDIQSEIDQEHAIRTISRTCSSDFIHWSPAEPTNPNLPDEHLYTSQTHPYFRASHIYVALPTRFVPSRGNSTEIVFMTSRAGSPFERIFADAYIRPGLDPACWGNRANYVALNVVPTSQHEMSIYHRSGHRYVLRTDGFVSINAPYNGGEMTTHPIVFSGHIMEINFTTSAAGSIRIEVQRVDGIPCPGFSLEESEAIVGDKISHIVSWKSGADLTSLSGSPVRLRFVMRDADLYAIKFNGSNA